MKEHRPIYLLGFIGGIIFMILSVVNNFLWFTLGFPLMLLCGIPYFGFEKFIPCPICKKQDRIILGDRIDEACGSDEHVRQLRSQPGVLFCKRCEYKFSYNLPTKSQGGKEE